MLRIVILPAAVSPANIISQKPRGFYITFRKENITPGKARNITFVHRTVTAMQAGNMRRQGLQVCHCEERSDVAISGRHLQIVQAAVKTYRPIASVAAVSDRLWQLQIWRYFRRMCKAPKLVIARALRARGNLAVPGWIVGQLSAKTQLPSRDCHGPVGASQ